MARRPPRTFALTLTAALLLGCAGPREHASTPAASEQGDATAAQGLDVGLDELLAARWQAAEVEPSERSSDAEFLRRVTLDLIGRIPSRAEVDRFLANEDPDKRAQWVDELLARDSHAAHWATRWADPLLPANDRSRRLAQAPLESHLAAAIADNRRWDRVVTELLSAEGEPEEQPAVAFLAARGLGDRQAALGELAATTARVFLGARIECAQCHDHPYEPAFTQADYWAMTAYFGRLGFERERGAKPPRVTVFERQRGELRIALGPDDDPRKRAIAPRFLGSETPAGSDARRSALAASIVADPRFAEATVGWVWTQLFGRGLAGDWDDRLGAKRNQNPELEWLTAEFRRRGHDLRWLLRTAVLSSAYQRSSRGPAETAAASEAAFARAAVRPLSAEQLFASLLTATDLASVEQRAFRRTVRLRKRKAMEEFAHVFTDDEMARGEAFTGSVSQALLLQNGGLTNQGAVARPGGALAEILTASPETEARASALWRTVYARDPRPEELKLARTAVGAGDDPQLWEDLMFAMLVSSEFASNH